MTKTYDMFGEKGSGRTTRMIQRAAKQAQEYPNERIAIVFSTQAQAQAWRENGRVVLLPNLRITSISELGVGFDPVNLKVADVDHVFIDHWAAESYLGQRYKTMVAAVYGSSA